MPRRRKGSGAFSQQRGEKSRKHGGGRRCHFVSDQPQLSVDHLNALVALAPESFAVSSFLGAFTPPIYFSSACFPYVKGLTGDEGARRLLKSGQLGAGAVLEAKDSGELDDIDTPEEYDMVRRAMS